MPDDEKRRSCTPDHEREVAIMSSRGMGRSHQESSRVVIFLQRGQEKTVNVGLIVRNKIVCTKNGHNVIGKGRSPAQLLEMLSCGTLRHVPREQFAWTMIWERPKPRKTCTFPRLQPLRHKCHLKKSLNYYRHLFRNNMSTKKQQKLEGDTVGVTDPRHNLDCTGDGPASVLTSVRRRWDAVEPGIVQTTWSLFTQCETLGEYTL